MKKQKRIPYESYIIIYIIYFFLQFIYVYAKGTCVSVSDGKYSNMGTIK